MTTTTNIEIELPLQQTNEPKTIADFSTTLLETIQSKNTTDTLLLIKEFKEMIKTDSNYVVWITDPKNLIKVQQSITENLKVPHKMMMIKKRQVTRAQNAMFFLQAMENGIKKVL